MSYVDQNLMSGEQVAYRAKLHWIAFAPAVAWLLLALVLFAGKASGAGGFFLLVAVVGGIFAFLNFSGSEFAITNKRVIVKVGVIRRQSLETLLNKVEGVSVNQGIGGRIFGYGTITVNGTGSTKEPFKQIANPLEFRRAIQEQIDSSRHGAVAV